MSLILREKVQPIEPPISKGHTSGSGEGRMEHQFKLMANVPITPPMIDLSQEVLDLEKEKDAQDVEILRLKKRVESSDDDLDEEDAYKQGRKMTRPVPCFIKVTLMDLMMRQLMLCCATTGVSTAIALCSTLLLLV
ncbi:hypothetical protein Tco_0534563 [Tanacetum coccineum]